MPALVARTRKRVFAASVLALLLVGGRLLWVQGLVYPVHISGGSMAPRLLGRHLEVTCGDCGLRWAYDVEQKSATGSVVCQNCGRGAASQSAGRQGIAGQRVLIDRGAFLWRRPRRWELVALQDQIEPDRLEVKRLVGLPSEEIEIRGGDVYQSGRIVRKSLSELRDMAILVHDNSRLPPGEQESRWAADRESVSGWRRHERGFLFVPPGSESGTLDWLSYRHRACFAGPLLGQEGPVLDNYGFNQGVSRELHPVSDLLLRCVLSECRGSGRIAWMAHDGQQAWILEWAPMTGEVSLRIGKQRIAAARARRIQDRTATVEYSVCDDQLCFALDGTTVLEHPYSPEDSPLQPTSRPLAIGGTGMQFRLERLQVFRDVFYLDPACRGLVWSHAVLAEDEYLVLGDNVPISRDSRHWTNPGVKHKSLVGKVLTPF